MDLSAVAVKLLWSSLDAQNPHASTWSRVIVRTRGLMLEYSSNSMQPSKICHAAKPLDVRPLAWEQSSCTVWVKNEQRLTSYVTRSLTWALGGIDSMTWLERVEVK